jgi:hypothetical protein
MSTSMTPARAPAAVARREHRAERQRLARCDALAARLAELHAIRGVLTEAAELVALGWTQGGWFTVGTPTGEVVLTAYDLRLAETYPVVGACLVGSVVHAVGGPDQARTQLVQRTLDLTWHALRDESAPPGVLCPSPAVRSMRLLDLTRWNDAPGRTQDDVVALLGAALHQADRHRLAARQEHAALTSPVAD